VRNQLGEKLETTFTINITDVATEPINVVEITDTTLDQVYYYYQSFTQPTKLVFTNLTSVSGTVYFDHNPNLVEVDFPALTQTGDYFYFDANLSLATLNAPVLQTVHNYLYITNNTALTTLAVCGITQVLPGNETDEAPFYFIYNNTPTVDAVPACFSLGAPANLAVSNVSVAEDQPASTLIGTLSADTNYPTGTLTYYLVDDVPNSHFAVVGNELLTTSTFDFEAQNSYEVAVGVRNQLGEKLETTFTINITDVVTEPINVVEITDTTLDQVYYYYQSFTQPTKLVFTNLTSVSGIVYFDHNPNLVEVDFPALTQTGSFFYADANLSLVTLSAPVLQTVHDFLYITNNTVLTTLDVCGLSQILPSDDANNPDVPYYYVQNNTALDFDTTCLVNTTITFTPADPIIVLPAPNTLIGTLSSDTEGEVTYFFVDENGNATTNDNFIIVGNGIYLANDYDTYTESDFNISVGAIRVDTGSSTTGRMADLTNGLNEKIQLQISINISNAVLGTGDVLIAGDALILYPNPVADYFRIKYSQPINDISLFDMAGRKLNPAAMIDGKVNVSGLPQGSYTVVIHTGKETVKRMIIKK
jgi:hypothetical protein